MNVFLFVQSSQRGRCYVVSICEIRAVELKQFASLAGYAMHKFLMHIRLYENNKKMQFEYKGYCKQAPAIDTAQHQPLPLYLRPAKLGRREFYANMDVNRVRLSRSQVKNRILASMNAFESTSNQPIPHFTHILRIIIIVLPLVFIHSTQCTAY